MELFKKNGYFSKTAMILVMTYTAVLVKFLVGGMTIAGLAIPVLDTGTATSLLGAATTLYFTTHNLTQWKGNGNGGTPPAVVNK